ncbi:TadE family type IV pilus minor pilin [Microbacterium sp.]|uniref:TadE family type IV pilus minor pilin n=1 Tax=Microbacterium sp. TaxID=51671 RepID=UPI0037370D75
MIRDERGSATAEFAVVVPAVVVVLALAISALGVGGRQVRLEQGAAQAARLAARGDSVESVERALDIEGLHTARSRSGDLVCVRLTAPAGAVLPLPDLRARSCALGSGAGEGD